MDQRGIVNGLSDDQSIRVHLLHVSPDLEKPTSNGVNGDSLLQAAYGTESNDPAASSVTVLLQFSIFVACCGSLAIGFAFSLFGSLLTVGALVGSLMSGKISDSIGRKHTMGLADILCIVGWFVIALSQGVWWLYLGRLMVGFPIGTFYYVVSIYIAEVAPRNLRGGAVLTGALGISCGICLTWLVGLVINWRVLAVASSTPCMIQLIGLFFIPESPRWLLKTGHYDQYKTSLQQLRGYHVDISQEAIEIKMHSDALQNIPYVNYFHLFQRNYAYALIIVFGLMALSSCGGTVGVLFYASSIFKSAGLSTTIGLIALAIIRVLSTVVGLFLMDKVGRRPLLMISASGSCFGCILCGLLFLLKDNLLLSTFRPYLILFGITLFFAMHSLGLGGVPSVIMSEIFPMNVKGLAGSIASTITWSAAWIISYVFSFMVEWSSSGTFFVFACVNVCTLVFIAKLVPETKKRSLEEIQESITQNH